MCLQMIQTATDGFEALITQTTLIGALAGMRSADQIESKTMKCKRRGKMVIMEASCSLTSGDSLNRCSVRILLSTTCTGTSGHSSASACE